MLLPAKIIGSLFPCLNFTNNGCVMHSPSSHLCVLNAFLKVFDEVYNFFGFSFEILVWHGICARFTSSHMATCNDVIGFFSLYFAARLQFLDIYACHLFNAHRLLYTMHSQQTCTSQKPRDLFCIQKHFCFSLFEIQMRKKMKQTQSVLFLWCINI